MLCDLKIQQWYQRLSLSDEARAIIHQIRTSQPVRSVQSFKGNVLGRYPSRKMGVIIQFESHKNELAFIYEYEHDSNVLEYFDQPSTIKLDYEAANGRCLGVLHTPDFFVLRSHSAGWEECKTEAELIKLEAKNPNRCYKDTDGIWRCPPGEAYAATFGLYYRIRCSSEINWTFQRNIGFLEDYLRSDSQNVAAKIHELLLERATAKPGISLRELFERTEGVATRDDIFMLIANENLYVDLSAVPLVEAERVCVFPNRDVATAHANLVQTSAQVRSYIPRFIDLSVGSYIEWDNNKWRIVNVSETVISLMGEGQSFTEVPVTAFEKLVQANRITGITVEVSPSLHPEAKCLFEQADRRAYAKANHRYEIVRAYINGDPMPAGEKVSGRTKRRLKAKYLIAQERYGIGYVGLLPRKNGGNKTDKLSPATRALINEIIEKHYETYKQKRKFEAYASYRLECEKRGIIPASYKTFTKALKRRPRHAQILSRQGPKAAYKYEEFYWELSLTTPRHGERPFHIVHIDHTELDVELVCSMTGQNLGRPWATFLTDAYSRRLLAVSLAYDRPSYRSCMMILRELVRRFGRFPQIIVVDGGKEFSGVYFETLLAVYECTKKTRPPAKSRFGSICERLFGTTNTRFVHNLLGNTQITRDVRQVTKAVNPKRHAVWTLEKLYLYLREWAYEIYDTIDHPALGQCPRDAFNKGIASTGERKGKLIPYDEDFRTRTLPTTPKTTAKVSPGRGVKIKNYYYWSEAFRHPEVEGTSVSIRYDPFNVGRSYAYVRGQWIECYSERHKTFHDRSEREVMIATSELRRQQTRHSGRFNITATKLAHFLESVEAEEVLLRQNLADKATRNVLDMINAVTQPRIAEIMNPTMSLKPDLSEAVQQTSSPTLDISTTVAQLEVYGEF